MTTPYSVVSPAVQAPGLRSSDTLPTAGERQRRSHGDRSSAQTCGRAAARALLSPLADEGAEVVVVEDFHQVCDFAVEGGGKAEEH